MDAVLHNLLFPSVLVMVRRTTYRIVSFHGNFMPAE
jgi:hypothetical protein